MSVCGGCDQSPCVCCEGCRERDERIADLESGRDLFADDVKWKDIHDVLYHVLVAFDPERAGFTPSFQKGALVLVGDLLGVDMSRRAEALEAEVIASPTTSAAPIFPAPDAKKPPTE